MITLFALAGAIALIVLVQLLRAMLALPLARQRLRWLEQPPPPALTSLYAELGGQLTALGFGEPRWLQVERVDGEPETMSLRAVYLSADAGSQVWAAPPVNAKHPHRMALYFSDLLADGRTAISQPFDAYFELLQGGDLVARTASEPTLAAQWQAHRRWVETLGSSPRAIADDKRP